MEDRFAFVKFTNNVVEQNVFSQNNSICTESASTHQVLQKPLQKTISTQLFSNVWLTFMCNVAGIIHFYATFRDIGTDVMNIYKEDTLYIVNVTLCDFFNGCGKVFWSYFCIFVGRGKICIAYYICIRILNYKIEFTFISNYVSFIADTFSIQQVNFTSNLMSIISLFLIFFNLSSMVFHHIR